MHIAVRCPVCGTQYQLDPSLLGKRMRCPNRLCGEVFEVQPERATTEPAPAPPAPEAVQQPQSVASLVPILPAEIATEPPQVKTPRRPASVSTAPAREKPRADTPAAPRPAEPPDDGFPSDDGFPGDFPGDDGENGTSPEPPATALRGTWEAPPVRATPATVATPDVAVEAKPLGASAAAPRHVSVRRIAGFAIVAMVLLLSGLGGLVYLQVRGGVAKNETGRWEKAEGFYKEHNFSDARALLQRLVQDFPDSENGPKYRFLAELSDVREAVYAHHETADSLRHAVDQVGEFLRMHRNDPVLKDWHGDIFNTLNSLTKKLAEMAEKQHDAQLLDTARRSWKEAKQYQPPAGTSLAEAEKTVGEEFARVQSVLAAHAVRQEQLAQLQGYAKQGSALAVRAARTLVASAGLKGDTEIEGLVEEAVKAHRASVRFVPAAPEAQTSPPREDRFPTLAVTPGLVKTTALAGDEQVVLALAQGVLYALEPHRGDLRWARRVGIDTQVLPLRLPPDSITPELVLVVSADRRSVAGVVAATGATVWECSLSGPCLGRPILVERRLLVPALTGQVDEVETASGRLLGSYQLGQPLTVGGARQPDSPLVYFPADEYCVYLLDVVSRSCAGILYTGHAAGTLRSDPTILRADAEPSKQESGSSGPAGWLLLSETQGDDTVLKPYALPLRGSDQPPAEPRPRIPGNATLAAHHEGGKLALATDTGYLSLWGVRQRGNREDPLFFPWFKEPYPVDPTTSRFPAQVVHADAGNFWLLTHGRLHRLQCAQRPDTGPGLVPRWPEPPFLGRPLHASQYVQDAHALVVVTQTTEGATCLASAVDADSGRLRWQRQLGCVPVVPPVLVANRIAVRDANGLFLFDAPDAGAPASSWRPAGELLRHEPLDGAKVLLLPRQGELVQLTWPSGAGPCKVQVRRFALGKERKETARSFDLPAPPHGDIAEQGSTLLVPLANGLTARLGLEDGTASLGIDWRSPGAETQHPGHCVVCSDGDVLLTDGSRGLSRFHWPPGGNPERRAHISLAYRTVHPPVAIPAASGAEPRICVADASGTLTLLDSQLRVVRRWPLAGPVSAGPFVRRGHIGCIVARDRLVWIDPDRDAPLWEYRYPAEIVGEPPLVAGKLVVADVAGGLHAIEAASGRPVEPGYVFRANVAAAAAPVAMGDDRLFVPLCDGTIVLVPLSALDAASANSAPTPTAK